MGVKVSVERGVAELTLDWPEVRNAMGPDEGRQLREALERLSGQDIACLIIAAEGKAFCAGGNLPAILELAARGKDAVKDTIYRQFQGVFRALYAFPVPVIAAVNGPAVGFGCDLALASSVTLIGKKGWLAQGWGKAGLVPATGGVFYSIRRGSEQAMWALLARDRIDGEEAQNLGLGIACDDALETAREMAASFAGLPRGALRAVKDLARIGDFEAHLAKAVAYQTDFITAPTFADASRRLLGR